MSGLAWSDATVRSALGMAAAPAPQGTVYSGVSTDSRTVEPGDLYVALAGARFDGHDFLADALARGARGAVVSRPDAVSGAAPLYAVADTLVALGALAAWRRGELRVPVVAITGSAGKTTTKDLTRGALAGTLRVHATKGNLNNRIGMPLTLLATPDDAQAVVLELGTNEPGEIGTLARIARADVGVVITVGEAHLEKLGSVEGVLAEKLDLLRNLAPAGQAVVGDEPDFLPAAARAACSRVRVAGWSERADAGLRPERVESDAGGAFRFRWRGHDVALSLPGRHAVLDALLALAVAEHLGVPAGAAAEGVSAVGAGAMRGEVRRVGGLTLLVDCYNANPPSVRAALDLLAERAGGSKVAVLGSMLELGPASAALHAEVLRHALSLRLDLVVATGAFADVAAGIRDDRIVTAADWKSGYPALRDRLAGDEVVLLKASRGVALEGMLPLLVADFDAAPVEEA
ncbi:MAG TPA: UDP-N-acetylmuramoyl-tripeptide--D-alanyl-D-alanine ligase [Longimicrobiales bacterium]|nr:UDP-N-acetylmuramoyl-tripeptide--D-alanyl-D-alanine ligase [Longimicrobiales bacterium]